MPEVTLTFKSFAELEEFMGKKFAMPAPSTKEVVAAEKAKAPAKEKKTKDKPAEKKAEHAEKKEEPAKKKTAAKKSDTKAALGGVSFDDIKDVITLLSEAKGVGAVKDLFKEYEVKNAAQLDESQYGQFYLDCRNAA